METPNIYAVREAVDKITDALDGLNAGEAIAAFVVSIKVTALAIARMAQDEAEGEKFRRLVADRITEDESAKAEKACKLKKVIDALAVREAVDKITDALDGLNAGEAIAAFVVSIKVTALAIARMAQDEAEGEKFRRLVADRITEDESAKAEKACKLKKVIDALAAGGGEA
ncbi:MAG: hypothetical protein MJZ81_06600 [Bacteroidales bacterium]|nr:hypothetical protein [Bacteroidales bacterium]